MVARVLSDPVGARPILYIKPRLLSAEPVVNRLLPSRLDRQLLPINRLLSAKLDRQLPPSKLRSLPAKLDRQPPPIKLRRLPLIKPRLLRLPARLYKRRPPPIRPRLLPVKPVGVDRLLSAELVSDRAAPVAVYGGRSSIELGATTPDRAPDQRIY